MDVYRQINVKFIALLALRKLKRLFELGTDLNPLSHAFSALLTQTLIPARNCGKISAENGCSTYLLKKMKVESSSVFSSINAFHLEYEKEK